MSLAVNFPHFVKVQLWGNGVGVVKVTGHPEPGTLEYDSTWCKENMERGTVCIEEIGGMTRDKSKGRCSECTCGKYDWEPCANAGDHGQNCQVTESARAHRYYSS